MMPPYALIVVILAIGTLAIGLGTLLPDYVGFVIRIVGTVLAGVATIFVLIWNGPMG